MRRFLIAVACLLVFAGLAGANPVILQMQLGINTAGTTWNWNHVGTGGPLGVSATPGGPLITGPGLGEGVYYLYAGDQRSDINNVSLQLWATDSVTNAAYHFNNTFFNITGIPGGTFGLWDPPFVENFDHFNPLPTIWLGWAQGTADLVGSTAAPNGANDIYLVLGINQQPQAPVPPGVPEPSSMFLMGPALAGLVALLGMKFRTA